MATSRLSSKGQIVIPRSVRQSRQWTEGTELVFEDVPEGVLLRSRKPFPSTRLEDGLGCVGYSGPPRTDEEIEQALIDSLRSSRRSSLP